MSTSAAAVLGATIALTLGISAPASAGSGASGVAGADAATVRWADAGFGWASAGHYSFTDVTVSRSPRGDLLNLVQIGVDLDADGSPTSTVLTVGTVDAGFTAQIDAARFSGAALDAVDVPVQVCTYTSDQDPGTCAAGTVDVHVRWTGAGAVVHEVSGSTDHGGGWFTVGVGRSNATTRPAQVDATVSGLPERLGDPEGGSFGRATQVRVIVCTPVTCRA